MDLNINFYDQEFPNVGDIVTINLSEPENDIIKSTIEEYPNLQGIMQISDLTFKKKIKSVRQYLSKKPVPAEVTDVDKNNKIISLSRKYIKKFEKEYLVYYSSKVKLLNLIKKIHHYHNQYDFNELIKNIIYPINKSCDLLAQNYPFNIFEILEKHYDNNEFFNFNEYHQIVMESLNELFKNKPKKYITKFNLICSQSVNNIIYIFETLKSKYSKVKFRLESVPNYYLESFGVEEEEQQIHNKIIEDIQLLARENKVLFKKN